MYSTFAKIRKKLLPSSKKEHRASSNFISNSAALPPSSLPPLMLPPVNENNEEIPVKGYMLMKSRSRKESQDTDLDYKEIFDGALDEHFSRVKLEDNMDANAHSRGFRDYTIFASLEELIMKKALELRENPESRYVLRFSHSPDKEVELIIKGLFSRTIIDATRAQEILMNHGKLQKMKFQEYLQNEELEELSELKTTPNPNFKEFSEQEIIELIEAKDSSPPSKPCNVEVTAPPISTVSLTM